jgi:hypothetical protein
MPFDADLRVCYARFEMNMSWVYEELEKSDLQLEFPLEEVVAPFERHIEERLSQYMCGECLVIRRMRRPSGSCIVPMCGGSFTMRC